MVLNGECRNTVPLILLLQAVFLSHIPDFHKLNKSEKEKALSENFSLK